MPNPTTMRAIEFTAFDGPNSGSLVERPVPTPGAGEVLIRIGAAGVNYADVVQSRGGYRNGPQPPYIAGIEACGEVVAVGDGDTPHAVGTKVFGAGFPGTFAEYVAVPAAMLQPLPAGWSEAQGAAFFVVWATAYACLRTVGNVQQGQSVLIHAAAGGVGQAATKLAKHFGARVFATASTAEKLEIAKGAGADELINYADQDFVAEIKARTQGRGVDLILEMIGGETFDKNFQAVVPHVRIVVFGFASDKKAEIDNFSMVWDYPVWITGLNITILSTERPDLFEPMMGEISALIASGVIDPGQPTEHPLADAPDLLAAMELRKTTGKHIIVP